MSKQASSADGAAEVHLAGKTQYLVANLALIAACIGLAALIALLRQADIAAPYWPIVSVALTGALLLGRKASWGIIGGIVASSIYLGVLYWELPMEQVLIRISWISLSTIVQIYLGYYLLTRYLRQPNSMVYDRDILKFYLLAGPLASWIAPAVLTLDRLLGSNITNSEAITYFFYSWLGYSFGTVILTPLLLTFFAQPRAIWAPRILTLTAPVVVMALVFTGIVYLFDQSETQREDASFKNQSSAAKRNIEIEIATNLENLYSLKSLLDSSTNVTRPTFRRFAQDLINRHPEIKAVSLKREIEHSKHSEFEQTMRELGYPQFEIKQFDATDNFVKAEEKNHYLVVSQIEPEEIHSTRLGFDLHSHPDKLAEQTDYFARDNNQLSVSQPFSVFTGKQISNAIIASLPIYKQGIALDTVEQRRTAFVGTTSIVFDLQAMIENTTAKHIPGHLGVCVFNIINLSKAMLLNKGVEECQTIEVVAKHQVLVGNKTWELRFFPKNGISIVEASRTNILFVGVTLSLFAILNFWLLSMSGRRLRTEHAVSQRTAQLQTEIENRERMEANLVDANRLLMSVSTSLSHCLTNEDKPSALDQLLQELLKLTNSERAFIGEICYKKNGDPYLKARLSDAEWEPRWLPLQMESDPDMEGNWYEYNRYDTPVGIAISENRIVVSNNPQDDFSVLKRLDMNTPLESILCVPFSHKGAVLGVVGIYNSQNGFSADTIAYLDPFIATCGIVLNGLHSDKTRRELTDQLSFQASHDSLTGLYNRHKFESELEVLVSDLEEITGRHSLCFLDLDQFKVINDTCGHIAGDELLCQISQILLSLLRSGDTLARFGGDEFAVLLKNCPRDHLMVTLEKIRSVIADYKFTWDSKVFKISVSIGVVPVELANVSQLLQYADTACYAAKDAGRNQIHVYELSNSPEKLNSNDLRWVSEISAALENDLFELAAQPIISLEQDVSNPSHLEFLVRMQADGGDLIMPGSFMPAAERYNMSGRIDHWVIDNVLKWMCSQNVYGEGFPVCSINLSGLSISQPEMVVFIIEKLDKYQIPGNKVCFEITETAAISNLTSATQLISQLQDRNCHFALDDFGSGLSSYGYLKNLPVDYLKIDGSFVKDICEDPIDFAMVKSINEIGHVMGKRTIAEFVENDAILEKLKELGVDYAQGYGISKPLNLCELINQYPAIFTAAKSARRNVA